jgi:PAS domain S-box-containing protein
MKKTHSLAEPSHIVQFYENDDYLLSTLAEYVYTGLSMDDNCVVIATGDHLAALEEQLIIKGISNEQLHSEQYLALDAAETLAKIMVKDMPDWDRFVRVVGSIVAKATKREQPMRAYGEMVALLWEEGNHNAVLKLEKFWNYLAKTYDFSLFCAYPLQTFSKHAHAHTFAAINNIHTHVIPAESYSRLEDPMERRRAVTLLQQKAEALKVEMAERQRVEAALKQSEARYRRLFETAMDGILVVDAETYEIIEANPFAAKLLETKRHELVSHQLFTVPPFEDGASSRHKLHELLPGEQMRHETYIETSSGKRRDIEIMANCYRQDTSTTIQLNLRDITERKKTMLLQTTADGLAAERQRLLELNTAKDEFLSLASHQLRTPATGVKQYLGMVIDGYYGNLTEHQENSLQKAYESNERQLRIISDLLLVARVDAGKVNIRKEPCEVVQLIREVLEEQQQQLKHRGQVIELNVPRSLTVPLDRPYMRMVLENLVSNAIKYSPDDTPIVIAAKRTGKSVSLEVIDKGVGISKKDQRQLYHKFSRIQNARSAFVDGTGLGLYWCKKIVELHDGTLSVASNTSKSHHGSTFTIRLPG